MLRYRQLQRRKQAKYCATGGRTIAAISDLKNTVYPLQNNVEQRKAAVSRTVGVQMNEHIYCTP